VPPLSANQTRTNLNRRHRKVGTIAAASALFMLGLAFASVPLYRMFCQVTGYGGTTQRAVKASDTVLDRTVTVRFDATVGPQLPWTFEPVQREMRVKFGETALAFYRATNNAAVAVVGTASFNVTPDQVGSYFNKLECFCFTEQRLEPGESINMPVSFFVDPAMVKDKDAAHIGQITLSYTFFPVDNPKTAAKTAAKETKPDLPPGSPPATTPGLPQGQARKGS
jgi:cytochrome c oxidase assembly protein subunit 11